MDQRIITPLQQQKQWRSEDVVYVIVIIFLALTFLNGFIMSVVTYDNKKKILDQKKNDNSVGIGDNKLIQKENTLLNLDYISKIVLMLSLSLYFIFYIYVYISQHGSAGYGSSGSGSGSIDTINTILLLFILLGLAFYVVCIWLVMSLSEDLLTKMDKDMLQSTEEVYTKEELNSNASVANSLILTILVTILFVLFMMQYKSL